uniref:Uncharacterized protein n=1 Tax=Rhizophora mucronata TaxID=61149 RepID=A0A2P2QVF5_RHIMU
MILLSSIWLNSTQRFPPCRFSVIRAPRSQGCCTTQAVSLTVTNCVFCFYACLWTTNPMNGLSV